MKFVIDIRSMFHNCKKMVEIKFNECRTGNLKYISTAFAACYKIRDIDISHFSIDDKTPMSLQDLIVSCNSIETLKLPSRNKIIVYWINYFAAGAINLKFLDLSMCDLQIRNDDNITRAFNACYKLTKVLCRTQADADKLNKSSNKPSHTFCYVKKEEEKEDIKIPEWVWGEYQPLEYIQGDSTRFIDTGLQINYSEVEIETKILELGAGSNYIAYFGNLKTSTTNGFYVGRIKTNFSLYSGREYSSIWGVSAICPSYHGKPVKFHLKGKSQIKINKINYSAGYYSNEPQLSNLQIFGAPYGRRLSGYLYYFKANKLDGTKIIDYLPVKRKSDNVAGVLDLVNKEFKESSGTAPFIAGPEIKYVNQGGINNIPKWVWDYGSPVEYLESTGTQFIRTNMLPDDFSKYELKIRDYQNITSGTSLFGSESKNTQGNRIFSGVLYGAGNSVWIGKSMGLFSLGLLSGNNYHIYMELNDGVVKYKNNVSEDWNYKNYIKSANPNVYLCVFCNTISNNSSTQHFSGKYEIFKMENKSSKIHLIPLLDKNSRPCMFDIISKTYFYNQGTGEFLVGPTIQESKLTHEEILERRRNNKPENLLLNSSNNGQGWTNSRYPICNIKLTETGKTLQDGESVTFVINSLPKDDRLMFFNSGGSVAIQPYYYFSSDGQPDKNGTVFLHRKWNNKYNDTLINPTSLNCYLGVYGEVQNQTIKWVKLVRGYTTNKEWYPSPYDE